MSRAGRKRKHMARREANGGIQRAPAPERTADVVAIAMAQPHRCFHADPRDPRLENELGRMLVRGEINHRQYAAGRRWAGIVARMRRAIDAPSDQARGLLGVMVGGASGTAREMTAEEADEARAAYADADHAIGHAFGPQRAHSVRKALKMAIISDQRCSGTIDLRQGLNVLATHFDL
jgi:hypothetical protein